MVFHIDLLNHICHFRPSLLHNFNFLRQLPVLNSLINHSFLTLMGMLRRCCKHTNPSKSSGVISFAAMRNTLLTLRGTVGFGCVSCPWRLACQCCSLRMMGESHVGGQTKVPNFGVSVSDQNVGRLDITVNHIIIMHLLNSVDDLVKQLNYFLIIRFDFFNELLKWSLAEFA